jgi:hypothetical protein
MKCCRKCKKEKELGEFYNRKTIKSGIDSICKSCVKIRVNKRFIKNKQIINNRRKELKRQSPWNRLLSGIKQRCENPNNPDYKYYGERGIKCLISIDDIKALWIRDNAQLMI